MRNLNQDFETFGDWWLVSDNPRQEKKLSGQLVYSKNEFILRLNGSFSEGENGFSPLVPEDVKYKFIHGVSKKGEVITLCDSQSYGSSFAFNNGNIKFNETIYVGYAVIGVHLNNYPDFSSMRFRIPYFDMWISKKVVETTMEFDKEAKRSLNYKLQFNNHVVEQINVDSLDTQILLLSIYKINPGYQNLNIIIDSYIEFKVSKLKNLHWFLDVSDKLLTLINLISGYSFQTDSISAIADIDLNDNKVDVIVNRHQPVTKELKQPYDLFLTNDQISLEFSELCNNWFNVVNKVSDPAMLARSTLSSEQLWLHVKFLSLIHCLEGLHRCLYENNISLRDRLKQLEARIEKPILEKIVGIESPHLKKWVDTRNYYSHWEPELKEKSMDDNSIHLACYRIQAFIACIYANLVGIESSDILKALEGSSKLARYLAQVNSEVNRNT